MSDNITPFIIRIQTALEKGGIEGAKDELAALTAESKKSADQSQASSGSMQRLGSSASQAAGMMGNLSSAMASGGQQASQMGGAMSAAGAILTGLQGGIMGVASIIAAAGVSMWIKYNKKVEESTQLLKDWRENLHEKFREANEERLTKLGEQYDETKARIDALSSAYDRLAAAQASVDSAEKAARLADINLREKEALAAIEEDPALKRKNPEAAAKQAELMRAEASNLAAQERRALEQEFEVRSAQQAVGKKEMEAGELNARSVITDKEIAALKAEMQRQKTLLEKITKERASLENAPLATKQALIKPSMGPYDPAVYGQVEDTDAMQVRRDRIRQLSADEKSILGDGKEKGSYEKLAEALLKLIDTRSAQQVEAKALGMETAAAERNLAVAQTVSPRMNAAESAISDRDLERQHIEANRAVVGGRLQDVLAGARTNYESSRVQAAQFDASDYKRTNRATYGDAQRIDRDLDRKALEAKRLLDAAVSLQQQVDGMNFDELARALASITRRLDALDKSVKDAASRAARPGSGG